MNIITKKPALNFAVASELTLNGAASALAGIVAGAGLTAPAHTKNIVTGADGGNTAGNTYFATRLTAGATTEGEVTTGSVAYGYTLKISWTSNLALCFYQEVIRTRLP
jgi:hypothetical protein